MSKRVREAANLLDALPEEEQELALEVIRRIVLAWDPDFTKLTVGERQELDAAREDEELTAHSEIDWN